MLKVFSPGYYLNTAALEDLPVLAFHVVVFVEGISTVGILPNIDSGSSVHQVPLSIWLQAGWSPLLPQAPCIFGWFFVSLSPLFLRFSSHSFSLPSSPPFPSGPLHFAPSSRDSPPYFWAPVSLPGPSVEPFFLQSLTFGCFPALSPFAWASSSLRCFSSLKIFLWGSPNLLICFLDVGGVSALWASQY